MNFIAVYLHTIDPYAVKLWDGGPIRWYGLSYLIGFLIAYQLIRRVIHAGRSSLTTAQVGDFVITVAIGIVVGGRLGYVLFYRPEMLWTLTSNPPFWDLLAIHKGGMASHGGMIGAVLATWWTARRADGGPHRWPHLIDLVAFAAPLGLFFGRIANFINGELIGRPCHPKLLWAVRFPHEMYNWNRQQIARLAQILDGKSPAEGVYPLAIELPVAQIIDQIQQDDLRLIRLVEPLLTPRHPSQLYQAVLEGLLVFVVLAITWQKPRQPGLIGGLFCGAYGILRIIGEAFREPDAHIGIQWLGLTRGQWLSVGLLLGGVLMTVACVRRKATPMGGWRLSNGT